MLSVILRMLRKAVIATSIAAAVLAMVGAIAVWVIVRDEVAELRQLVRNSSGPLPAPVSHAILAAEGPGFLRYGTHVPWRCLRPKVVCCGSPSVAYLLGRNLCRARRSLGWHVETALVSIAIARLFTPNQLFSAYGHEAYLGVSDGRQILGVDAAAQAYFAKPASQLTTSEAAVLAGMLRSPVALSPLLHPERALTRRNLVLQEMRARRFITEQAYVAALAEPLRVRSSG